MPLNKKGMKILSRMRQTYTPKKAKEVFFKMVAEQKITGVEGSPKKSKAKKK